MKTLSILLLLLFSNSALSNNIGSNTGLEIPRYVSLKNNDANIRVGPSINYPIKLKYIVQDFPLKISEEYNDWRKVSDFQNNYGWLHKSLIKGERSGIINTSKKNVRFYNTINGKIIGEINNGTIIKLKKCKINWCQISKNNITGWVIKKNIWGVEKKEVFNIGYFEIFFDYYYKSLNFLEKVVEGM